MRWIIVSAMFFGSLVACGSAVSEADPNDTVLVITGENHRSAHEQRSDLEQILKWVEETRQSISTPSSDTDKPNLSIFG